MEDVIFRDIKKRFSTKEVLSGVSFSIHTGEIFGLVGKSGCGKSTLFKILIGMVKTDNGEITFEQKNVLKNLDYLRKKTGFATQENMLFDELTIKENSFYFGKLYSMNKGYVRKRFIELLHLMGLDGFWDYQIDQLSGGMKKRANLLVSLIHNPRLLVLDEPTVGLDPLLRNVLWDYINKINKEGVTILVTSHLLDEIEKNCNRVAILKKGKVLALASMQQYKNKYGKTKSFREIFEEIMKL